MSYHITGRKIHYFTFPPAKTPEIPPKEAAPTGKIRGKRLRESFSVIPKNRRYAASSDRDSIIPASRPTSIPLRPTADAHALPKRNPPAEADAMMIQDPVCTPTDVIIMAIPAAVIPSAVRNHAARNPLIIFFGLSHDIFLSIIFTP